MLYSYDGCQINNGGPYLRQQNSCCRTRILFLKRLLPRFFRERRLLAYSKSIAMLGTAQNFHAHWFFYCSGNIQQFLATKID